MSNATDEFQRYSYQYKVKLTGVPEMNFARETVADTSNLCASLSNEMWADVADIDITHRVPLRNTTMEPKPIIFKFTKRLAKKRVMA